MTRDPIASDPLADGPIPTAQTVKRGRPRKDRDASNFLVTERGKFRLRFDHPSVARFLARAIVRSAMDYEAAITEISAGRLTDAQITSYADKAKKSPDLQKAIEAELTIHGLDEKSKDAFVTEMWDWLRSTDPDLKMKAASILGRGFISEKIIADKPEELPVAGLNDAINSMLGIKPKEPKTIDKIQEKQNVANDALEQSPDAAPLGPAN